MNKSIKKELRLDAVSLYKQSMQSLYSKWCSKGLDSAEIRLEYLSFVQDYVMDKTRDALRHRIKRVIKKRIAKRLKKNLPITEGNLELNKEQFGSEEEDLFKDL